MPKIMQAVSSQAWTGWKERREKVLGHRVFFGENRCREECYDISEVGLPTGQKEGLYTLEKQQTGSGIVTSPDKLNDLLKIMELEGASCAQGFFFDFTFHNLQCVS